MDKTVIVIGGGINGMCIARALARKGLNVTLLERDRLGQATSSSSSRLLHGGLRYLEHGQIRFVWEALEQRARWLEDYPSCVRVIENFVPIYREAGRPAWQVWLGVKLYNLLAGRSALGPSRWWSKNQFKLQFPELNLAGCIGAVSYFDLMMDDQALMAAIRSELIELGVGIREGATVDSFKASGEVSLVGGEALTAHVVINAAGPWVSKLLNQSNQRSDFQLDYNRGVHLVIDRPCHHAAVLQQPDGRIVFSLPLKQSTLFGTTEQLLVSVDDQRSTAEEVKYLKDAFNRAYRRPLDDEEVLRITSGIRPIVKSAHKNSLSSASREAEIEVRDRLINVFGGKWTSAPALASKVVDCVTPLMTSGDVAVRPPINS